MCFTVVCSNGAAKHQVGSIASFTGCFRLFYAITVVRLFSITFKRLSTNVTFIQLFKIDVQTVFLMFIIYLMQLYCTTSNSTSFVLALFANVHGLMFPC